MLRAAPDDAIATAAAQLRTLGGQVDDLQVDLSTREGVMRARRASAPAAARLDAVAPNAGVGAGGAFLDRSRPRIFELGSSTST